MQEKYSEIDHSVWKTLINMRMLSIEKEACLLYVEGLRRLQLPLSYIPSCEKMNQLIQRFSTWEMIPSNRLIPCAEYFMMLSQNQFPAITSIRPTDQIYYYNNPDPDVIHEYLGHGPFLINPDFANFMQKLATIAKSYPEKEQMFFGRLFWFTVEFGLIETEQGLRAYGAGIIPSATETKQALYNLHAERREFNLVDIMRTPIKNKVYYVIPDFETLFSIVDEDLNSCLVQARRLGNFCRPNA